jgi:hypothetical protein
MCTARQLRAICLYFVTLSSSCDVLGAALIEDQRIADGVFRTRSKRGAGAEIDAAADSRALPLE